MVNLYVRLIILHGIEFEDIPDTFKNQVEEKLKYLGYKTDGIKYD